MRSPQLIARAVVVAVLSFPLGDPSLASADGYFSGSKGARAAGRAGAFVAKADDLSAAHFNPAGFARVDGWLLQGGNRFSYNAHRYERQPTLDYADTMMGIPNAVGFEEVKNDQPLQLLDPTLGVATDFGLEDWGFALVIFAPAGIGRQEFPEDGGQRYMMIERDSKVVYFTGNVAWKHEDTFGVGLSLQWISVPSLKYSLMVDGEYFLANANPVSSTFDMLTSIEGTDLFTPNLVLGAWYRPLSFLEIGVSGQVIPTDMVIDGTLDVQPLNEMLAGEVTLQRDGELADDVDLTLPLPITARLGVRYIHEDAGREVFDIEFDVGYESWSRVEAFTLDSHGMVAEAFGQDIPIDVIEIDKQWRDTISLHLGSDFMVVSDLLTGRAGFFYETPLAPVEYTHVDFVSGAELGGGLGASLLFGDLELAIAYELRIMPEVSVRESEGRVYQEVPASLCEPPYQDDSVCHPELLGQPSPTVNGGTYVASSNIVSLDVLYRF
jgi:long-chain fatty acid transport protein